MNRLPTEILSFILQHLDNDDHRRPDDLLTCTLVNRHFYTSTIPILWQVYNDHKQNYQQSPSSVLHLTTFHPLMTYLRQVKLHKKWTDADLIRLMTRTNHHMTTVYIVQCYADLTDKSLQVLPQHWSQLTILHLRGASVTRATTTALAQHCHQLECLRLIECRSLTSDMFAPFTVASNQRRRRPVNICLYTDFEDPWNEQTLMDLSHLPLAQFSFQGSSVFMHALLSSPSWCPQLTSIDLRRIDQQVADDAHLIPFLKSHPLLKNVELEDCNRVTDATLDAMAMYLPWLKSVHVDGAVQLTCRGVINLVCHCCHLDRITLQGCDIVLEEFPENCIDEQDQMVFDQDGILRLSLNSIMAIRQINLPV